MLPVSSDQFFSSSFFWERKLFNSYVYACLFEALSHVKNAHNYSDSFRYIKTENFYVHFFKVEHVVFQSIKSKKNSQPTAFTIHHLWAIIDDGSLKINLFSTLSKNINFDCEMEKWKIAKNCKAHHAEDGKHLTQCHWFKLLSCMKASIFNQIEILCEKTQDCNCVSFLALFLILQ